jgi:hypothetical protein
MDSERKKAPKEKRKRDCREIGYWDKDIDPHFKFKFQAAPMAQYSV